MWVLYFCTSSIHYGNWKDMKTHLFYPTSNIHCTPLNPGVQQPFLVCSVWTFCFTKEKGSDFAHIQYIFCAKCVNFNPPKMLFILVLGMKKKLTVTNNNLTDCLDVLSQPVFPNASNFTGFNSSPLPYIQHIATIWKWYKIRLREFHPRYKFKQTP